ncbi:MAG: metal-dependent hydrolase [Halanaeroarchaeum sp.]
MNERDHVVNAVLLAAGIGVVLSPALDETTARTALEVGIPVVLGALFPDLDATVGSHRKTFHNLLTLGLFAAFPLLFSNLYFVWVGVLTHYVLDLAGNVRGMALFYPWPREYDVPVGVTVDDSLATVVTVAVTFVEVGIFWAVTHGPVPAVPWPAGLFPA